VDVPFDGVMRTPQGLAAQFALQPPPLPRQPLIRASLGRSLLPSPALTDPHRRYGLAVRRRHRRLSVRRWRSSSAGAPGSLTLARCQRRLQSLSLTTSLLALVLVLALLLIVGRGAVPVVTGSGNLRGERGEGEGAADHADVGAGSPASSPFGRLAPTCRHRARAGQSRYTRVVSVVC
jgi:hypothetical protein